MPTVSVIISMYNSVRFIKQAIESILNQTYKDIEVIIINDGSTDGSGDVVRQIHDDRIIFIDRENRGLVPSLNEGIEIAKGKYIARLDSDDWCYPTRIEKQVDFLNTHMDVVLVGTLHDIQRSNDIEKLPANALCSVCTPEQIRYSLVFDNFAFAHSSFMMRKDVLNQNGIRYELYKQVQDYHLITQLSKFGKIARIPEALVVYRIYAEQCTQIRSARMKQDEIDRAREQFINTLPLDEAKKVFLKKGVLRKLKNKDDILGFDAALEEYRRMCALDEKKDTKCLLYLYAFSMSQQFCTPSLLFASFSSPSKKWLLSKAGIVFIIRCLLKRHNGYLETELKI